ncbi:MAG: hypothetical protein NZ959_11550 [Armatimonadetes bacterium]|nr:hypothetical protein [Armatimonadota bacterium]MDW8121267.1 hypothetical protein [Armatimonadota bacterium]
MGLGLPGWTGDPLFQIVVATILGGLGQAFIKQGVSQVGVIGGFNERLWQALLTPGVLAGFGSYALSSLLYLMVVSKRGLSFAYPFVAANQVVVFLLAWILFQENIPPLRLAGIAIICLGVVLVGLSR